MKRTSVKSKPTATMDRVKRTDARLAMCERLEKVLTDELSSITAKEDAASYDEGRVKQALSIMKGLKELEDMRERVKKDEDHDTDPADNALAIYQRLRKRVEEIVGGEPAPPEPFYRRT